MIRARALVLALSLGGLLLAAGPAVAHAAPAIPATCSGTLVSPHTVAPSSTGNYFHVQSNGYVGYSGSGTATQFCKIHTTYNGYNWSELRQQGTSNCVTEDQADFFQLKMEGCNPGGIAAQNWIISTNNSTMWNAYNGTASSNGWDVDRSQPLSMEQNQTPYWTWGW